MPRRHRQIIESYDGTKFSGSQLRGKQQPSWKKGAQSGILSVRIEYLTLSIRNIYRQDMGLGTLRMRRWVSCTQASVGFGFVRDMSPEEIKGSEGTGGETDRIEYAQFPLSGGLDRYVVIPWWGQEGLSHVQESWKSGIPRDGYFLSLGGSSHFTIR